MKDLLYWLLSNHWGFSWWQILLFTLAVTHITIVAVTIFLHRAQAHRALELGAISSHFFRLWLWLTTGMVTKEWVAIHRKHHAKCESADDPHSPRTRGIGTVLLRGSELYRAEAKVRKTLDRYGHGTPDDWLECHVYAKLLWHGVAIMLVIDVLLFGIIGLTVWAVQMLWIPVTAAGVINGLGHFWGYRNFETEDASTNISPWGILIGGEELHNNHHAYPTSAKFSVRPREFDIGWLYIQALKFCGLANVKYRAPELGIDRRRYDCDVTNPRAVIDLRYELMARMTQIGRSWYIDDNQWINLQYFRERLKCVWKQTMVSPEMLTKTLQDWCHDAKRSGIPGLEELARMLPGFTVKSRLNEE